MKQQFAVETFWQAYLDSLPEGVQPPTAYGVWSFGSTKEIADELGALAKAGIKTATSSLIWEYEVEGEALPKVGDVSIVTDGARNPLCIIETTELEIKPYNQVDEAFADAEGEGDRSLVYWRRVHWEAFSATCRMIGRTPTETMPVLCERFRVVFAES